MFPREETADAAQGLNVSLITSMSWSHPTPLIQLSIRRTGIMISPDSRKIKIQFHVPWISCSAFRGGGRTRA